MLAGVHFNSNTAGDEHREFTLSDRVVSTGYSNGTSFDPNFTIVPSVIAGTSTIFPWSGTMPLIGDAPPNPLLLGPPLQPVLPYDGRYVPGLMGIDAQPPANIKIEFFHIEPKKEEPKEEEHDELELTPQRLIEV
jgi:hypothetical protein